VPQTTHGETLALSCRRPSGKRFTMLLPPDPSSPPRSFWVAFSRNLNSTGTDVYPLTPGSTHNLIAAWASGGVKDPVACDSNYPKHKGDWKGHVSF